MRAALGSPPAPQASVSGIVGLASTRPALPTVAAVAQVPAPAIRELVARVRHRGAPSEDGTGAIYLCPQYRTVIAYRLRLIEPVRPPH